MNLKIMFVMCEAYVPHNAFTVLSPTLFGVKVISFPFICKVTSPLKSREREPFDPLTERVVPESLTSVPAGIMIVCFPILLI